MMWVYVVGIATIYRGIHMMWVYTVDDSVYSVGHKSAYIPWVICCVHNIDMMWVTWLSTVYIHVIHIIYPTVYDCIYRGRYAVDNTSYDVGIYCVKYVVDNTSKSTYILWVYRVSYAVDSTSHVYVNRLSRNLKS